MSLYTLAKVRSSLLIVPSALTLSFQNDVVVSSPVPTDTVYKHAVQPDFDPRPISPISECSSDDSASVASTVVGFGRRQHCMLPTVADPSQDLTQSTVVGFGRRRHFQPESTPVAHSEVNFSKYENRRSSPLSSVRTYDKRQSLPILVETQRTRPSLDVSTLQSAVAWEEAQSQPPIPPMPVLPLPEVEFTVKKPTLGTRIKQRIASKVKLAASSRPVKVVVKRFSSQSTPKPVKIGRDERCGGDEFTAQVCAPVKAFGRFAFLQSAVLWPGTRYPRTPPVWI
ncbi:hypothetical protein FB45DRAFT_1025572 [Roridomyces roridus]|uniref:Uncharacterized protein n=1 Tax=Roridomyces roridus TaxID=1738132 RepID=A0AAD7FNU0_9AGAR|nr:hypothetical protein FB45DRAFT_1025572 [Roridomyces roridus]